MGVWEVDCYCVSALILLPFEGAKGDRKAHPKTEKYGKLSVTFSHFINIDEAEKILTTLSDGINAPVGASVQVTVVDTTSPEVTAALNPVSKPKSGKSNKSGKSDKSDKSCRWCRIWADSTGGGVWRLPGW